MGFVFVFGYAAETVGMTDEIGAFVLGLVVGSVERFKRMHIRDGVVGVSYGLFIPLFFASIGGQLDVSLLADLEPFIVTVVVAGISTKAIGGYIGSRLVGRQHDESLVISAGVIPKSEVGLAIVGIGLAERLIDSRVLSAFLFLMLVSILITPLLLNRTYGRLSKSTLR